MTYLTLVLLAVLTYFVAQHKVAVRELRDEVEYLLDEKEYLNTITVGLELDLEDLEDKLALLSHEVSELGE